MDFLIPKYRRDPNAMVHSAYVGVASGMRTVTRVMSLNKNVGAMESSRNYGAGLARNQSGRAATLILGGMETTLDEIEYMLEGIKEKKFVPLRKPGDISKMCQMVAERRNDQIKYFRKNPSEAPKARPRGPVLLLPVGVRWAPTSVPGFSVAARG